MTRNIGLHLRVRDDLSALIQKAIDMRLRVFQCFLTSPLTTKLLKLSASECDQIASQLAEHGIDGYVHISYHANLCEPQGLYILRKEISLAQKLGFKFVVVHPGSAKWCGNKEQGLQVCIETLNTIISEKPDITIILENSAHANFTIGGDLNDFGIILKGLKQPDKIKFCIDTAHAYAIGYDLAHDEEQDRFIALVDQIMSIHRIALIHLNDTLKKLGSFVDQHHIVGEGLLGKRALSRFINQPALVKVPVILELPLVQEEQEKTIFEEVCQWNGQTIQEEII